MAITLEEAYEIIRRYRRDMRLHLDHVCDVLENADRHKLVDCPCDHPAVYTTFGCPFRCRPDARDAVADGTEPEAVVR
jgi:hypothetical protein